MKPKACPSCGVTQTLENSNTRKVANAVYFSGVCKKCNVERTKRYRRKNIEARLLHNAKNRDKACNLTVADIVIPKVCPVLNIPLTDTATRTDNTPSIDRLDNSIGYQKGNVFVISWRANRLKCNATLKEMQAITKYMETKCQQH